MSDTAPERYGVWVYYPWSQRLVHLLDEPEFIELRTNRNLYKITAAERNLLAQKAIGIIGLSVLSQWPKNEPCRRSNAFCTRGG